MQAIEPLSVRVADLSDIGAVDALFARSYPILLKRDYPPSVLVTTVPLIARAQPRLLASGRFFVAERAGRIVGAGGWSRRGPLGGDGRQSIDGHVRHVVVDHRVQRQGIGRAILGRVMEDAERAGICRLNCLSTLNAVPFYTAMCFLNRGRIDLELPRGIVFPVVRMKGLIVRNLRKLERPKLRSPFDRRGSGASGR